MYLANNPEFYDWLRHGGWGSVWNADKFNSDWYWSRPRDNWGRSSELKDDSQAYDEAWQTIRAQPGMFFYARVVRVGRFWSPLPHQLTANETPLRRLSRYAVGLWYLAEFLLAIIGLWRFHTHASAIRRSTSGEVTISPDLPVSRSPNLPLSPSPWHWGLLLVVCLMAGHVVYWTDMRMRAPIMPVVAICAAAGLACHRSDGERKIG